MTQVSGRPKSSIMAPLAMSAGVGSPVAFDGLLPQEPVPAPRLGQHTDEILADRLGLSESEIGALHDDGVVAGASTR